MRNTFLKFKFEFKVMDGPNCVNEGAAAASPAEGRPLEAVDGDGGHLCCWCGEV